MTHDHYRAVRRVYTREFLASGKRTPTPPVEFDPLIHDRLREEETARRAKIEREDSERRALAAFWEGYDRGLGR